MHEPKSDKDLQAGDGAAMGRLSGNWGAGSPAAYPARRGTSHGRGPIEPALHALDEGQVRHDHQDEDGKEERGQRGEAEPRRQRREGNEDSCRHAGTATTRELTT